MTKKKAEKLHSKNVREVPGERKWMIREGRGGKEMKTKMKKKGKGP